MPRQSDNPDPAKPNGCPVDPLTDCQVTDRHVIRTRDYRKSDDTPPRLPGSGTTGRPCIWQSLPQQFYGAQSSLTTIPPPPCHRTTIPQTTLPVACVQNPRARKPLVRQPRVCGHGAGGPGSRSLPTHQQPSCPQSPPNASDQQALGLVVTVPLRLDHADPVYHPPCAEPKPCPSLAAGSILAFARRPSAAGFAALPTS